MNIKYQTDPGLLPKIVTKVDVISSKRKMKEEDARRIAAPANKTGAARFCFMTEGCNRS
jgi:hypothetical protein